ncbi:MAG: cupin fold metalloprotein, WbuC family [Lysobacteraceae bacterium]|nr:MAG: cupin fold metalloprotein, WbuC family [Xanthomonadaceae bacterium]
MNPSDNVRVISPDFLDRLTSQAVASPRQRQHYNLHATYDDPCQRFFNAVEPGSYLRPHRQALIPRSKLLVAVRGRFALLVFDDAGGIVQGVRFAAGELPGWAVAAEVPAGRWNTVLSLSPGAVLLEAKAGPFDPDAPREPAPWAPEEGGPDVAAYMAWLFDAAAKLPLG